MEVITVPDFRDPVAARFELRTLLFLGSWMLHEGQSRSWPLHLACIGRPPDTVRQLADRAGATVTVHDPVPAVYPPTANRFRVLEIAPRTARFLLLDTDVLILRDLAPMAQAVGHGIGLGPASFNHLPEPLWRQVFAAVGVPYVGGGTCWDALYDLREARPLVPGWAPPDVMPPYFNSGVVLASWGHGLGELWYQHYQHLHGCFTSGAIRAAGHYHDYYHDQYALTTAAAALSLRGIRIELLPLSYHARPLLLRYVTARWSQVAVFHYSEVLGRHAHSLGALKKLLYGHRLAQYRRWAARWLGLRVIRSPVYRSIEPGDLRAFGGFFDSVHRILLRYGS